MIAPQWMHSQIIAAEYASAGPDWNADTGFDVRLRDVPLNNRRPDVVVYRADTIDVMLTRPRARPAASGGDRRTGLGDHRPDREARPVRTRGYLLLLACRIDCDRRPGDLHLSARLRERAVPGRRDIHRSGQGHRPLPGRDRPAGLRVPVRAPWQDEGPRSACHSGVMCLRPRPHVRHASGWCA